MIWYPPYHKDPDSEEEAMKIAEHPQLLFKVIEDAAAKYPGHTVDMNVHIPTKKGGL
jgi:hypothetical protein